jgi:hypothetical protein
MNAFHLILLILKLIFVVQFFLVMVNKSWIDNRVYITTEFTFKILLSLYIEYILFVGNACRVSFEDHLILGFGAGLLTYDAIFNDLPDLLEIYNVSTPSILRTKSS